MKTSTIQAAGSAAYARPAPNSWRHSVDWRALLPLLVVVLLVAFFSYASAPFATLRNFSVMTGQAGTLLIVCTGATFVILMGSIDLAVGAIVLLTGALVVTIVNNAGIGWLAIPLAGLIGAGLGGINGAVYTYGRVPSFVVTLGSMSVLSGIALIVLSGRAVQISVDGFEVIAVGQFLPGLPNIALVALLGWLAAVFVASNTRFGRYMYLIGGGEVVARTAGVPVRPYKVAAFAASGFMAGIAAVFAVARLGAAGPSLGQDLLLNSLAAIVVGGTSLAGGVGGPKRTLLGVLIISILDNGLNLMGVSEYSQMIFKGGVVVAAALLSTRGASGSATVK